MPTEPSRLRRQLGFELKRLRTASGLALRAFAEPRVTDGSTPEPIPHPRLQRAEKGEALLTRDQLVTVFVLTGADPETRERVEVLHQHSLTEHTRWSLAMGDEDHLQKVAGEREQVTGLLSVAEVAYLPGLLQTQAYARALFGHLTELLPERHDAAAAAAARVRRQDILFEPDREFRFLLTPYVLVWAPGPDVSMDAQRDRIGQLAELDAVSVRIISAEDRIPTSGFQLHERMTDGVSMVAVELESGDLPVYDPPLVEKFRQRFLRLWSAAQPYSR